MPDTFTIGENSYTIDYKHEDFRHGRLDNDHSQSELKLWLQYAFSVSNKNILILDGYMMAVYQHNATEQFVFFDSHSRNEIGLMTPEEGTSVLLIFDNFQNLLEYLLRLIPSLGAKYFGIQPIITHSNIKEPDTTQRPKTNNSTPNFSSNKQSESNVNEDIPSCSTWKSTTSIHLSRVLHTKNGSIVYQTNEKHKDYNTCELIINVIMRNLKKEL